MKIETDWNTALTAIIALVVILGLGITWITCRAYNERAIAAFKQGLEEGSLPGKVETYWVYPKGKTP